MIEDVVNTKLFWITTVVLIIYGYLKFFIFNYWKRKGVPHEEPLIPFGNALPVLLGKISAGESIANSYEKFKKHRFHGVYMFHQPLLVINDPELIRHILIKDFNKFRDRGLYHNEEVDPTTSNLFFLPGEKWRRLRAKLSPIFTSGKLKQMFPLIKEVGDDLVKVCNKMSEENNIIECKNLIGRYTADSISSTAFGFNCESLKNPENEFKRHLLMVFDQNPIKVAFSTFAPMILDILRIPFNPRKACKFFFKFFEDIIIYRRQNHVIRKDFVNLLMQLMDKGLLDYDDDDDEKSMKINESGSDSSGEKLSLSQAQAQVFVFFVAGNETTSSTITYCLYELALNPEIQEKVHAEIDELCNRPEGLTYDLVVNKFEYLHMVFCEALRKHPSLPFLNRLCLEDYKIPDSDFVLEKGMGVMIPVSSLHRDPNIFPDPDKFDPTRFTKENIASRSPYAYLPFGDGPRFCIASRFATIQSKIALISVLSHFKFSVCDKTAIPVHYSNRTFVQTPAGGVYLKMEQRHVSSIF